MVDCPPHAKWTDGSLYMHSLVSAVTGKPFVHLAWGGERGQLSCAEARLHGLAVVETAEGAEMDAIVIGWLTAKVGMSITEALPMLGDLRALREEIRAGK